MSQLFPVSVPHTFMPGGNVSMCICLAGFSLSSLAAPAFERIAIAVAAGFAVSNWVRVSSSFVGECQCAYRK